MRVFLIFAFSSPEDMGWDPSVTFSHIDERGDRQYNIFVDGHVYKTILTLSDYAAADGPLGRATRVWKVRDHKGNVHVLKDLWLELDRSTEEYLIYEAILTDVEKLEFKDVTGDELRKSVAEHLLTPLCYGRVQVSGKNDDTKEVILHGYDTKNAKQVTFLIPPKPVPVKRKSLGPSFPSDKDHVPLTQSEPPQRFAFHDTCNAQRYHYRIVFKEYATAMYEETNLRNIIEALRTVIFGMSMLPLMTDICQPIL